jgi:hypothetical protein
MSKNEHLVPPPVADMIDKLVYERLGENERMALIQRLEVTRDKISKALEVEAKKKRK